MRASQVSLDLLDLMVLPEVLDPSDPMACLVQKGHAVTSDLTDLREKMELMATKDLQARGEILVTAVTKAILVSQEMMVLLDSLDFQESKDLKDSKDRRENKG